MTSTVEFDGDERINISCSYDSIDEMLAALKSES